LGGLSAGNDVEKNGQWALCLARASAFPAMIEWPMQRVIRPRVVVSSRVCVGTEARGTTYSLADVNCSKKESIMVREAMTKLKIAADKDVGVALTSRARMRINIWE
jgi:hypothetical protein